MNIKAYLQLCRPANIITAIADILAGVAIANFATPITEVNAFGVLLLCISTVGLYGGGIVFNDIFDLELDKIERPERAIPSGRISLQNAFIFGTMLLLIGIISAFLNKSLSGIIASLVAILALVYDKYGKHHSFLGPMNMGLCRGGNLILGMSIVASTVSEWWWLGILPVCYIAAITMISRGEVHGGKKNTLYFAAFLYAIVNISQLTIAYRLDTLWFSLAFVSLHIFLIFKPLTKAISNPIGPHIGKAVKAGVLALIVMDAAWVSISGNFVIALFVLILLPISIKLAKVFAVT